MHAEAFDLHATRRRPQWRQRFGEAHRQRAVLVIGARGVIILNLLRRVSPRTVKETFVPPTDHRYPYMK